MDKPTEIGKCIGCDRTRGADGSPLRLDDRVCEHCLNSPRRGRKWAMMSHRCRTEPAFALQVYNSIEKSSGKKTFIMMYGLPEGATPPEDDEDAPPVQKSVVGVVIQGPWGKPTGSAMK